MAFCTKCGAELPQSGICANCAPAAPPPPPPGMPPPPQAPPPPPYPQSPYHQTSYGDGQGYTAQPAGASEAVIRNPGICILLMIVTCGIYYLYWLWVTHKQINALAGVEVVSGGMLVLGWFCTPVLWYAWYKWDNDAMPYITSRYGFGYSTNFILWLILSLIFGVGAFVMVFQIQEILNRIYGGR